MRLAKHFALTVVSVTILALGIGVASQPAPAQQEQERKVDFAREVLPLLSDNCFLCHGPDVSSRVAGLRLDLREEAVKDRGGSAPIVPGDPESSLIVQRINDHDFPMPPKSSGKSLTQEQIETIELWIKQGAEYGKHWAFIALRDEVPVPEVQGDWPLNNLDHFVWRKMQEVGLVPNPAASKERWLRRVTFDLTGLPPTLEEIDDFLSDQSDSSFEKVVDRLLASPHFGERMATPWLDAARYGDSYGYQNDLLNTVWPYRDWVIQAFNSNMPYDRFLTEQLAGDLLENPTEKQRLATTFNRLHRMTNEGGSIAEEFKTEYAADRVETFGTAVLGLTVGCARCHDHKYDPLTQKEYYQFFAYFNSINERGMLSSGNVVPSPTLMLPSKEQEEKLAEARKEYEMELKSWRFLGTASFVSDFHPWVDSLESAPEMSEELISLDFETVADGKYTDPNRKDRFGEPFQNLKKTEGRTGSGVQFSGDNGLVVKGIPSVDRWNPFSWSLWVKKETEPNNREVILQRSGGTDVGFCGVDLMLIDGRVQGRVFRDWPGNGIGVISKEKLPIGEWVHLGWSWDASGSAEGLKIYINGEAQETEVVGNFLQKSVQAIGDYGPGGGSWTFASRFRDQGFTNGYLDDVKFYDKEISALEMRHLFDGTALRKAFETKSIEDLWGYYNLNVDKDIDEARETFFKAHQKLSKVEDSIHEVPVMVELQKPTPAYLLARGAYDAPKTDESRVNRALPEFLPANNSDYRPDRLGLADWVTEDNHPLTARVYVNRVWQLFFGSGLVKTPENFGIQGAQPTHPDLLDYLAREFIDSGWNIKGLIKEVVLSSTYRQDSNRSPEKYNIDPENYYYSIGPSKRLEAEMVRDMALAVSGLLDRKFGGPPVNPYQPTNIWTENNAMSPAFRQSVDSSLYRRSIYTLWKRTAPAPNMMAFDAVSREACVVRRSSTNTPGQALVLLNDVQFVEAARALAERVLLEETTAEMQTVKAFQLLTGRKPAPQELGVLLEGHRDQRTYYKSNLKEAISLIDVGDSDPAPELRAAELAAMTVTVQTILNLDATIWNR